MNASAHRQPGNIPSPSRTPLRLVCAEVWGGNRAIRSPIELPGLRGAIFSMPVGGGRGGDVHYLSVCGSGLLSRACVADVVGHGEAVARIAGEMHFLIRRLMNTPDQRRFLRELNRRLERVGLDAMATAAAISYYAPSHTLSVSYAGHPPGWLFRKKDRTWQRLELESPAASAMLVDVPLAVDAMATFSRRRVRVQYGDRVVLVTDGVLEAPGPGRELFGEARMESVLATHGGGPIDVLAEAILDAIARHVGGPMDHDDVTFVILEFVPGPRGPGVWHALKNRLWRQRGNGETEFGPASAVGATA